MDKKILFPFSLLLAILFVLSGCTLNIQPVTQTKEQQTKGAEELINKDEFLRRLDMLCKDIPIFENYIPDGRGAGKNIRYVGYFYLAPNGSKVDYPRLRIFYIDYFKANGWEITEDWDFGSKSVKAEKNGFEVHIFTAPDWGMNYGKAYSIGCSKAS